MQCLKYCEFVRISSRYSLCLSICLALSHLILPVTPLRRVSNEVDCICSTADELLNSGKWTWWSLARSAYRGATVWKDDWCQEKNSKWLQASLCQCTKTLLTVKTFANVVWLHFKFRSTMQIILFTAFFFFFFRIEHRKISIVLDSYHWNRCFVMSRLCDRQRIWPQPAQANQKNSPPPQTFWKRHYFL